jgi:hypothetical protein
MTSPVVGMLYYILRLNAYLEHSRVSVRTQLPYFLIRISDYAHDGKIGSSVLLGKGLPYPVFVHSLIDRTRLLNTINYLTPYVRTKQVITPDEVRSTAREIICRNTKEQSSKHLHCYLICSVLRPLRRSCIVLGLL